MIVEEVTVEEGVEEEHVEKEKEVSKEGKAAQDGKEAEEEEENKEETVATLIKQTSTPPTVEATPVAEVTASPGKMKASKKRKTRSKK